MTKIMRVIYSAREDLKELKRKIIGKMVRCLLVRSGRKSKYDENKQETKIVEEKPKRSMPYQKRFE